MTNIYCDAHGHTAPEGQDYCARCGADVPVEFRVEVMRELIKVSVTNRAHSTQWMDARAREVDPSARLAARADNYGEPESWITPSTVRWYSRAR